MTELEPDLEKKIAEYYGGNPALLYLLRENICSGWVKKSRKKGGNDNVTVLIRIQGRPDRIQLSLEEAYGVYELALQKAVQKKLGRGIQKE